MATISCNLGRFIWLLSMAAFLISISSHRSWGLVPEEIMVLANRKVRASVSLADYYMKKRGIPHDHLIKLSVTDKEVIRREDYDKHVAIPVRRYLADNDPFMLIRCLVVMYGMPLKITQSKLTPEEKVKLKNLQTQRRALQDQMKGPQTEQGAKLKALRQELRQLNNKIRTLSKTDQISSLDSEIALVIEEDYPLASWILNPYFLGYRKKRTGNFPSHVFMVSRLAGPSEETVRRIIDDSVLLEKRGLHGKAYFDARWTDSTDSRDEVTSTSSFYDGSIHRAASLVRKSKLMPVVVDDKAALFQPGDCPEAALYCGWYSLAKYIDAFEWQPGAVGFHIASSECSTLKRKKSRVWCKMMLEKGGAATLGPVDEPYLQGFVVPEVFFGLLIQGRLTLAECYAAANPFWSWKMVLVGDPLYRPFNNNRAVLEND